MTDQTAGSPAPRSTGAVPLPPGPAADPGVPKDLRNIGVGFSLFLILAGLAVMAYADRLFSVGALSVCIGFGIGLAVFGTRIGGSFLMFNVVGAGAMAIALYLLLVKYPMPGPDGAKYLLGEIYQTSRLKDVRGRAKQVFLTGRAVDNGDFRFVVFENEIGDGHVRFNFDFPEGGAQKEFSIDCISAQDLKTAIGRRETLSLSLEEKAGGKFQLIETSTGRAIGRLNDQDCEAPATEPSVSDEVGFLDWLSIAAYAQSSTAVDIPKAVALLESDDGDQRDRARAQLASLRGAEAYKAMAASWNVNESSYRADLGRLVAWSAAIGQDRATAVALAEALSPAQLR